MKSSYQVLHIWVSFEYGHEQYVYAYVYANAYEYEQYVYANANVYDNADEYYENDG